MKLQEYQAGLTGLGRTLDRLREARVARDLASLFAPVKEALDWCVSLDDWHQRRLQTGGGTYRVLRETLDGGGAITGLRFARNAATHRLAVLEGNKCKLVAHQDVGANHPFTRSSGIRRVQPIHVL